MRTFITSPVAPFSVSKMLQSDPSPMAGQSGFRVGGHYKR